MDDLNAQQIVLLTLLVSFVTSIATGITTVSLLEQAPDPVTQTINRVVERTVERVVSEPTDNTETVIEREVETVVVNEEDLTIEAVEKNSRSLVRIYSVDGETRNFVKLGLVVDSNGAIVTDGSQIQENTNYIARYQNGESSVSLDSKNEAGTLALLKINESDNPSEEDNTPDNFSAAVLANSDSLSLGQSVISLSGENRNSVSTGIINDFVNEDGSEEIIRINTSVSATNVLLGSIILNLRGEVLGLRLGFGSDDPTSFIPINMVKSFLREGDLAINQVEIE